MKIFDAELKLDLLEINRRLETEKDEHTKKVLLTDKNYILRYLNKTASKAKAYVKEKLNKNDVVKFVCENSLNDVRLKNIKLFNINHEKISMLTNIFIEKSEFKLFNTYKRIIDYNGLKFNEADTFYLGVTHYIESLGKNYIHISKSKKISDYVTLVHELGHARMNNLCRNGYHHFQESYPIFLELVFSDYLKENGMIREAYNIKVNILNELRNKIKELNDEMAEYFIRDDKHFIDNYIFEYKYKTSKDMVLAIYLYNMYLLNPENALIKIDYFILNSNKLSEKQLLELLEIDNFVLNKEILNTLIQNLEKEKIK